MRGTGGRKGSWRRAAIAAAGLAWAAPAAATFHLMLIVEVFVGAAAAPDAQYVVLQMYSPDQTNLSTHPMRYYDAEGSQFTLVDPFGPISNGADNAKILVATSTAEALLGVTADLRVPVRMDPAGGKVCFDDVDCFAWGNYLGGAATDLTVKKPFTGFAPDLCARRIYSAPLDATDDTNDSEDDFLQDPDLTVVNNAGEFGSGLVNPDALFLDGFEDNGFGGWDQVVG